MNADTIVLVPELLSIGTNRRGVDIGVVLARFSRCTRFGSACDENCVITVDYNLTGTRCVISLDVKLPNELSTVG